MGLAQELKFVNSYTTRQSELTLGRVVSKLKPTWFLGRETWERNKKKFKERFTSLYYFHLMFPI